jgi:integrase
LRWAASRKNECAEETWKTYANTAKGAAEWLTAQGVKSFTQLTPERLTNLRDHWRGCCSAFTTNLKMKHLRIALKVAVGKKLLPENPADAVAKLTETATKRRDYRPAELESLMGVLSGEWRAAFLMGLNTGGQRLNDIAVLRHSQVDTAAAIPQVTFFAAKTRKLVSLPLLQITIDALIDLPAVDDPNGFVFPKIAALAKTSRSNQFRAILASVGLARKISHKNEGKRGKERETHELSFHSVRHTATSMLKAAGVTDGVVRGIVGHETVAMSKVYTHHDLETTLAALKKMQIH